MRRIIFTLLILFLGLPAITDAQTQSRYHIIDGDTVHYTYTPLVVDTMQQTPTRQNFIRRVVNYFDKSTEDHTFDKKLDITFAGGPSYSKTTKLGIAVLAAGLYRLDRTDSITPPSDISIYANVTTSGYFSVGVMGNNLFRDVKGKIDYDINFSSAPRDVWGIGYRAGAHNPKSEMVEERYLIYGRYQHRILPNTYLGPVLNFEHIQGRKFNEVSLGYLEGQHHTYTATGLGASLEYDSRDFIPNPWRGAYLSVQGMWFARGLGNCNKSLWRVKFRANSYHRLWSSGLLATDLNSEGTPWPLLARLGGNERMRGYYLGQYTDNNLLTAQVEIRQRIWRRIGCVVWGGAGTVFSKREPFAWRHALPNYGLGLRWELKQRVNVRIDYGFGRSTSGFLLSINEAF